MIEWVTEPVALGAPAGSGSVEWLAETVETYQPTGTLEDLVPSVRPEFDALVAQAQAWGMAPHVRSVGRTCAQQEANVKAGASHADLCRGMHVLGHAVDLDLSPNTCDTYTKLGAWWESRGGVWGGRWKNFGPCGDQGHFHYGFDGAGAVPTSVCPSGVTLEQCKRIREDYLDQAFGEAPAAPSKWGLAAGALIIAAGVAFVWAATHVRPGVLAFRENPLLSPDSKTPSEQGYVYHATNEDRVRDIAREGIKTHKPWEFTDQEVWPDGSTEKRSYFSRSASSVWAFAPEEGRAVILRTRETSQFKRESTGDIYTTKSVPASRLDVLTDGGWVSLTKEWRVLAFRENPRKKNQPKRIDLEFAGYKFTSGPEGTVIPRTVVRTDLPGDYGADPLSDGMFRMVPSGDIVDLEERNRRLKR